MTTPNGNDKVVAALRASLIEAERLRRQNQQLVAAAREPIAIVAMSCRFPGGVRSPEDLWSLVDNATDAMAGFPADRGWDLDSLYHPDPDRAGTSYVREGGFIYDAADFDADLFGISPREAVAMDPQQRLLLEASWELLERAGIAPTALRGRPVGTFIGSGHSGYGTGADGDSEASEGYALTGSTSSVASGRLAYTFGFEGPAVTIDTACSSSLVALHLAAQALRQGECDLALAGGAAVLSTPFGFVEFSRQRGLAADGRCKAFASAADGTGWGEGVGVLLLERLSDARRNGHQVLAVIRGSAVNQDGASNGLTAPNGSSQQRVIRQALANAQVSANEVDAVEAHGTGTRLGDPIEAHALLATYGQDRPGDRPLWLGSVKSNIGHTQYAAGVAGVIKMVMAMREGVLPRTLHVDEPSPHIDWTSGSVALLTDPVRWEALEDRPRRAGVSAFGISGTNAHVILEEAPAGAGVQGDEADEAGAGSAPVPAVLPWVVSAHTAEGLAAQAERLAGAVGGLDAVDVGWSLASGRAGLDHRAVVWGADGGALRAGLASLATGSPVPGVVSGRVSEGRLGVLFTGQGAQRARMGAQLSAAFPVFADALAEVCGGFEGLLPRPLADVLAESGDVLDQTVFTQAGLFAVEVALWRLVESFGVRADFLAGHSIGELSAAYVAGVFSLEDACRLVAARGALMQALPAGGGMLAVQAGVAEVEQVLVELGDVGVDVAAVNGPAAVVVSGPLSGVERVREHFTASGVKCRLLRVSHAFHSGLMDPMLAEFERVAASVSYRRPSVPVVSNLTGRPAGEEMCTAAYWVRHVREAVRFADGVGFMVSAGVSRFLELGPDATLTAMGAECVSGDSSTVFVPSMRRDHDEVASFTAALSRLWTSGVGVDWAGVFAGGTPRRVDLPTYAFQRERYWLGGGTRPEADHRSVPADAEEVTFWEAVERQDVTTLAETLRTGTDGDHEDDSLRRVLPALSSWRRRHRERSALDALRYRVTWKPLPAPGATLTGRWLVVVPDSPAGPAATRVDACLTALTAAGAELDTLPVRAAGAFRMELADEIGELLADGAPLAGVLSLLCHDTTPGADTDPDALSPLLSATVALVQALGDAGVEAPLWCATRQAVRVSPSDNPPDPEQSALWGLGRVVGLELPEIWGGLVDLPDALDERTGRMLAGALSAARGAGRDEDQLAVRPSGIQARRLGHAPAGADVDADAWPAGGTVLITGGTGALGAHVARSLAGAGAGHLLLVSRRGPDAPGAAELAAELRETGTPVTVAACDVADRAQLAELLGRIPADAPLSAVIHTAGVVDDGIVSTLTPESLRRVLRPKAAAAHHLDELTRDRDLKAFVLFSSWSGTVGSPGQAAYAAANAYLDALAERRRAAGLPATSVAWGPWAGAGMAGEQAVADGVRRSGLSPLEPAPAIAALRRAVAHRDTVLALADVDWDRFAPAFTAARPSPLVADLPEVRRLLDRTAVPRTTGGAAGTAAELTERLAALGGADRERAALDLVRGHVASALGHSSGQAIDPDRPFKDLGFDSLAAVNLRNRLNGDTGLRLPTTLVFDYPTSTALARHLLTRLLPAEEDPAPAARPPVTTAAALDDDPIAIIGMGCRLPGDVTSPEELWQLLAEGRDAITRYPADRGWDIDDFYHPDPSQLGRTYGREGGFMRGADTFDAPFFGISPREALAMDPQQRLLLEASWEVVERAGIDPLSLRGSRTGVFVGLVSFDYAPSHGPGLEGLEGFLGTGNSASVASGRVAYSLGLEGQAVTIDTACSSSLVALHLAAQALRNGECTMALAGGVTVLPSPSLFIEFSRQRGLSSDGRCRAFSADADGFGPAEGAGMLLLERLSDARRNGHRVLAVIRGSAVNQDGASNGLTAPNGPSQQRVIRQALAGAGLTPADVDAVEAHGTGTSLGDPIEAQALLATYGQDRPADRPLWLGSVKSNIGHTQAAAGVTGVIKMVLAMREGQLPRTLHVNEPSPHVDWAEGNVALLTEHTPWPETGRPRRAGVSSFGISGTNAHVILEAAEPGPDQVRVDAAPVWSAPTPPWLLSARDAAGLRAQAARIADHAEATASGETAGTTVPGAAPAHTAADIGWALLTQRAQLEHRAVVRGADQAGLLAGARAVAEGRTAENTTLGRTGAAGGTVFVFPGQGSQWLGMGRDLLAASPVFAARMAECDAALAPYVDWTVTELLAAADPEADWLRHVEIVQPALWAVMVSLAAVWEAIGVVPSVVIGHSQGELAAAVVAGALTLTDGARIVVARSSLAAPLVARGTLLSVAAGEEEVRARLARWAGDLSVAAVNGPASTVVSGPHEALDELIAGLDEQGIWHRRVESTYASHSPMMEEVREELLKAIHPVTPAPSRIPLISTVTGRTQDTTAMDADYWYANLREPVEFRGAVETALGLGHTTVVEISPHPVLTAAAQETAEALGTPATVVGTLRRDAGGPDQFTANAAELWVTGTTVDWRALFAGHTPRRTELPTYPFQRKRYWLEARAGAAGDPAGLGLADADHPLLGAAVRLATGDGLLLTGRLAVRTQPWLAEHQILGTALLPGSALVELAVRAGDEAGCGHLRELVLRSPLTLPEHGGVQLQLVVGAATEHGERTLGIHSRPEDAPDDQPWTCHAEGVLAAGPPARPTSGPAAATQATAATDLTVWPPAGAEPVDIADFYPATEAAGYGYGPAFQGLRAAWRRGEEIFAEVALAEAQRTDAHRYGIHPALLDAALQAAALIAEDDGGLRQPFAWNGVSLLASGATEVRVRLAPDGADGTRISLADPGGRPVAEIAALVQRTVDADQLTRTRAGGGDLVRIDWNPLPPATDGPAAPDGVPAAGSWAVLGDDPLGVGAAVQYAGHPVDAYPDLAALHAVLDAGVPAPGCVLVARSPEAADWTTLPAATATATAEIGALLDQWAADERLTGTRLVVVTAGAVSDAELHGLPGHGPGDAVGAPGDGLPGTADDTAGVTPGHAVRAAVLQRVHAAQAVHPGRFLTVDLDPADATDGLAPETLADAVTAALAGGEPRLAVRGETALVPRARRLPAAPAPAPWHPAGTALLTSPGTPAGTPLTTGIIRHLVTQRAVRRVILATTGGEAGLTELHRLTELPELTEHGVTLQLTAQHPTDPDGLPDLLRGIPDDQPLTAVIDTTGDARTVLRLHQLTADPRQRPGGTPLGAFLGYAPEPDPLLAALARHRRAGGLPGTAVTGTSWDTEPASAETLADALATALDLDEAAVLVTRLDAGAPRRPGTGHPLPAELRDLVPTGPGRRRAATGPAAGPAEAPLAQRLTAVPAAEREGFLAELIRRQAADVLGHTSADDIEADRPFKDLGFDSMMSVQLRNRLNAETGLSLPATLAFTYPTPLALAAHLLDLLQPETGEGNEDRDRVLAEIERLDTTLAALGTGTDGDTRNRVTKRLQSLLWRWTGTAATETPDGTTDGVIDGSTLESVTDDEMFELIDRELGAP